MICKIWLDYFLFPKKLIPYIHIMNLFHPLLLLIIFFLFLTPTHFSVRASSSSQVKLWSVGVALGKGGNRWAVHVLLLFSKVVGSEAPEQPNPVPLQSEGDASCIIENDRIMAVYPHKSFLFISHKLCIGNCFSNDEMRSNTVCLLWWCKTKNPRSCFFPH